MATDAELLGLAKEGKCDEIFHLKLKEPAEAYLWLLVARDLGHQEKAEECLSDLDGGHFHHDDEFHGRMQVHFNLASAYLKGERGLHPSVKFGLEHLGDYLKLAYDGIQGHGLGEVEALAEELQEEARRAVEGFLERLPFWVVRRRLERLEAFFQMKREGQQVPTVIEEHELKQLEAEVAELVRRPSSPAETG